jgi:hypothetical protein
MADKIDRLKKIEEKLKRLKELKQKIEKRIKKERKLAYEYAKEVIFWFSIIRRQQEQNYEFSLLDKLKEVLCKRAKNKNKCLERKLKIIVEHAEEEVVKKVAKKLLGLIEKEV